MTERGADSDSFEALSRELLNQGSSVRFEARGSSMFPCIRDHQFVHVTPVMVSKLRKDDIVLTKSDKRFLMHRLVIADAEKNFFVTRGDNGMQNDSPVRAEQILGLVVAKEFRFREKIVRIQLNGFSDSLTRCALRGRAVGGQVLARHCTRMAFRQCEAAAGLSLLALLPHGKCSRSSCRRRGHQWSRCR